MLKSLAGRFAVVFALLVGGLALVSGAGVSAQTVADVEVRDRLIADQEALLNVYRCMFGIDVEVVPGGCSSGAPKLPAKDPAPFSGNPTPSDIGVRDELVAAQEALLNTYRCRFRIDSQQVPGGCPEPTDQTDEETEVIQQNEYHTCARHEGVWCQLADGTWRVKTRSYIYVYGGDVQTCDELEVHSHTRDGYKCVPYEASAGQLAIFPHNCGPVLTRVIDLALHLENVFSPIGMSAQGHCIQPMSSWYYDPETVWMSNIQGTDGMYVICNIRDRRLQRHYHVCLYPDTDPSSLDSFQYLGLPDSLENKRVDRTNDAQIQKPYLNHDLVILRKFCDRYPIAEPCTRILGTQN